MFVVSDPTQGQDEVPANVTVEVKSMTFADVSHATLLTLEVTPNQAIVRREDQVRLGWVGLSGANLE